MNRNKMWKRMISAGLAAALVLTMTAAPAFAEQGIRNYYSASENGQAEDGIHAGDVLRHEEKLINSKAETSVGGFYIVNTKGEILAPNGGGAGGDGTLYTGPAKGKKGAPEYYYDDGQCFYPDEFLDLGQELVIKEVTDTDFWETSDENATGLRKIVVEPRQIEFKVVYHCNSVKCEKLGCVGFHTDTVTMDQLQSEGAKDFAKVWDAEGIKSKNQMFTGWNTKADGTGTALEPGDPLTAELLLTADPLDIVDVYAQWADADDVVQPVRAAKISGVKTSVKKGAVTVKWNRKSSLNLDGYTIYRSDSKYYGFRKLADKPASRSYVINRQNLKKGTRYYYKVRGYVEVGGRKVYTKYSSTVSAVAK
ncbi:MAG: fibronectin type III domain-containing protein [Firmicutes bacterium]|nr:fibronectin type III domain-containing protein [Bacillota bacterium]MDY5856801.1 fibronectin type III domain-containing protein [Anaerovoracaceae bacterium]